MLEFRLLGPFEVVAASGALALGGPRQRSVLVLLLLNAGQVVPVDRLVDALWGGEPPRAAESTLRGYVSHLRKSLRGNGQLITRPSGYVLEAEPEQVDAERFERVLGHGRQALRDGDAAEAAAVLRDGLKLWRGPALADLAAEPWARAHCTRLEELRQVAIETRVEADLALGRHVELVSELEVLSAEYPLRERLAAQRMLALYRSGRQAEALDAYRTTYALLAGDRGIEPDSALRELESAVLRHDPELDWVAPPRSSPAELPTDVTTFVGRAGALGALDEATGLVAIAGAAGIGKTALAVHWGHRVRARFPDGQLYVNLRGYDSGTPMRPVEALARFLRALGVAAEEVPIEPDEAAGRFRSLLADRKVLVLLDNAADAAQVRPLLPSGTGCLVIVTSRDRLAGLLAREGAVTVDLDVLTVSESRDLVASIIGRGRVAAEPDAVTELVRLCAQLPLALRIAAANLFHHTHPRIADYVAELREGDRLTALEVDGDEQSAIRGAFDLSFARLGPAQQELFRLLGLVPGPDITPDAAAALAGTLPEHARRLLNQLTAAHLVHQHQPGRYGMHDLLRAYAAEHARGASAERLYDWYLSTAAAATELLYPQILRLPTTSTASFATHADALAWLDAERTNLVAAITHTARCGPRDVAWRLADSLRGYLIARMHTVDWLTLAQAGLAAAEADENPRAQAILLFSLGNLHSGLSRYRQAAGYYHRVLALMIRTGWLEGQSSVHCQLGNIGWWSGQLLDAAGHFAQALELDQRTGRRASQAANLDSLGIVHRQLGRLTQAADYSRQGLVLFRDCGSRMGEAINLCNLGKIYHDLGRFDDALDLLTQALALHREVGDRANEAGTLDVLAAVHRDLGHYARALEFANAAVELTRETGERRLEADALNTVASINHRLGRYPRAADRYQLALSVARETETRYPEAEALIGLAVLKPDGHDHARAALAITREVGYRVLEGHALTALAALELGREQAVTHARQALELYRDTGHRLGEARALFVLGTALPHTDYRSRGAALLRELGAGGVEGIAERSRSIP